jgi:hypothetical protein
MNLSGILAVKRFGEEWRGSLVNEFGLKAFDFAVKKRRCRLLNTFALLNKWYIRKAIEGDLSFLFRATQEGKGPKGKRLSLLPDGTFRITNERQGIEYTFQPMTE